MVGVDVAAEGGLRAVNVACHTVPCHLQLKFAEVFIIFFSFQLEGGICYTFI